MMDLQTQRTILNANSRSTEIPFPFIYLFIYFDKRTSEALGGAGRTHHTPPPYGSGNGIV